MFEAVTVIYSGEFQKTPKVTRIRKAEPEILGNGHLFSAYQRVWQALPAFCKSLYLGHPGIGNVLTSPPDEQVLHESLSPVDELFKKCIVEKERDLLAKIRSRPGDDDGRG